VLCKSGRTLFLRWKNRGGISLIWEGHESRRERQRGMGLKAISRDKTYAGRYIIRGGTHSLTLPPELRGHMQFHHGDYVLYLLVGDVLRVTRVRPDMVLRGEFVTNDQPRASEGK
jgi:hypothetical protein